MSESKPHVYKPRFIALATWASETYGALLPLFCAYTYAHDYTVLSFYNVTASFINPNCFENCYVWWVVLEIWIGHALGTKSCWNENVESMAHMHGVKARSRRCSESYWTLGLYIGNPPAERWVKRTLQGTPPEARVAGYPRHDLPPMSESKPHVYKPRFIALATWASETYGALLPLFCAYTYAHDYTVLSFYNVTASFINPNCFENCYVWWVVPGNLDWSCPWHEVLLEREC